MAGVDPSPMLEARAARVPGLTCAQAWPKSCRGWTTRSTAPPHSFVVHFMDDPRAGVAEMARVVHPGGVVAACTWDFAGGMQLLRAFWEAARAVKPEAASETTFGTLEELGRALECAGPGGN